MNLVMIGTFTDAGAAEVAKRLIDDLTAAVESERDAGRLEVGEPPDRFSDELGAALRAANVWSLGPAELEQFVYDVKVTARDQKIVVTTDEIEVSAFLKILLLKGAKVEVFSGHDYPGSGHGRNT